MVTQAGTAYHGGVESRCLEIVMKKYLAAAVVLVMSSSAAYAAAPEAVHAFAKACGLLCC
jgi:PP-loop superfamily ATP-utilizing enzyme